LASFQQVLAARALEHAGTVIPLHPSADRATRDVRHHLLAYVEMPRAIGPLLTREAAERIPAWRRRTCRHLVPNRTGRRTAKALGFDRPMANSLDAVSDRDFCSKTLSAGVDRGDAHVALRRGIVSGPRRWSPGAVERQVHHRLLDHAAKAQPRCGRTVRAKTGRVSARSQAIDRDEGLPLAYQKDMQEDKQGAMEAFSALSLAVRAMTGMVPTSCRMKRNEASRREGYATATDLADWLVRTLKMPFPTPITSLAASWAGVKTGRGAARTATENDAGGRAQDHDRSVTRAVGRSLLKSHQLWRHRAEERDGTAKAWLKRLEKERKLAERINFAAIS